MDHKCGRSSYISYIKYPIDSIGHSIDTCVDRVLYNRIGIRSIQKLKLFYGSIAQLARAADSYPAGCWFDSNCCYHLYGVWWNW